MRVPVRRGVAHFVPRRRSPAGPRSLMPAAINRKVRSMTTLSPPPVAGIDRTAHATHALGSGSIFTDRDQARMAFVEKEIDRVVGRGTGPYYDSVVIAGAGFSATVMA